MNPFHQLNNDLLFPMTQHSFHRKQQPVKSWGSTEWAGFHQIHRCGGDYGFLFYIHKEKSSTVAAPRDAG